jgi:hypothetical protein
MTVKAPEVFQGSDWLTYRWAAAQAFDTLDRIRDLCLQMPAFGTPPQAPGARAPRYEMPEPEVADVFGYIAELCDDLAGELDAVQADLFPHMRNSMAMRWAAFEMRLHLKDLRARAMQEAEGEPSAGSPNEAIVMLAGRIKDLLKQIDQ